jgi:putative N6-adenine-specific DNA methylase
MKKFFVGSNIHFESELEQELREVWPYLIDLDGRPHANPLVILEQVPGGLVIEAPLHIGLQLHFFLKLANRILLRLKEFKVRDFPKMFQQFTELKKNIFLQGLHLDFQISAKESRLNNEKRIEQILVDVFGQPHETASQTLFVRMSDDLCSVSLDCTGTHLHKRTERQSQGTAPLRETLAAFCARQLIGDSNPQMLKEITLIDPMCGTGSLLREACTLYQPTLRMDFAFLEWSQTPKILKSLSLKGNYPQWPVLFQQVIGKDLDPAAIPRAQRLFDKIPGVHHFEVQDLFQQNQPQSLVQSLRKTWVLSNPPYGERLKASFSPAQLLQQIEKIYQPERVGLLLSEFQAQELERMRDSSLKLHSQGSFKNGGIPVRYLVFYKNE